MSICTRVLKFSAGRILHPLTSNPATRVGSTPVVIERRYRQGGQQWKYWGANTHEMPL